MENTEYDTLKMADLPWTAVESVLDGGTSTVVLPLGATEQHGPHLPLGTDTTLATALGVRVARGLGRTLVAPAVPVGPSNEHMSFPGTISVEGEPLRQLVEQQVTSLERHGFDRVVLLPGHGGWFPVIESSYPVLARNASSDVVAITNVQWYMELLAEGLQAAGVDVSEPVVHAGASETAMMLAIAPDQVGDDRPTGYTERVSAAALFNEGVERYDRMGTVGDPQVATAEVGEIVLEHVVDAYTSYLRAEFDELDG